MWKRKAFWIRVCAAFFLLGAVVSIELVKFSHSFGEHYFPDEENAFPYIQSILSVVFAIYSILVFITGSITLRHKSDEEQRPNH